MIAESPNGEYVKFDVNDSIIDLLKNDTVKATIKQNIESMAQESMKTAVQAIEGKLTTKNAITYIDVMVITKSDIEK